MMFRRKFLGTLLSFTLCSLLGAPAKARPIHGGVASGGGGGGGTLTTLAVSNPGPGALAANSFVQFAHGYGETDLPSGNILQITDDLSSSVPYTAMRTSVGGGTSVRFSDNVARLPNGLSAPIAVTSITHSGAVATVTLPSAHGLSSGAYVHMEGQAPDDYCGLYAITSTGANSFTYAMPTTPASNATTAGQMNYCRILTLASVAGSWNNTLPNGKTPTNIITDITTNFDNLKISLSSVTNSAGSTVNSGTFNADLATALASSGTNGQLRTPTSGQGQIVCDICAFMKFSDSVTSSTKLPGMSAWFYVTAFLDQTTGAVQELRCRVWIDNSLGSAARDYYTHQATLTLGSTIVRSTGLSSNAAIDGKLQSIAPSAVNTSTALWNIPGHGFVGGECIRLTTTGGLPGGFSTGTDYAIIWVDANNIALTTNFAEGNQLGNSSYIVPSTQGTGTHTLTCWMHTAQRNRLPYCRNDGLADRWTGKTGAFATQATYAIHSNSYLQTTKMVPPVDLTINLTTKAAFKTTAGTSTPSVYCNQDSFCYGGLGSLQYAQDAGGAGGFHEYGGPWTDKPLRKLRYTNDRGFAQTLRTDALMMGAFDMALINDDTTWRMPPVNNGPNHVGGSYSGLATPAPNSYFYNNFVNGFTASTSYTKQNGLATYSFSHRYILYPRLYFFEGGMDIHDMMLHDGGSTLLAAAAGAGVTFPTSPQISAKQYLIGGTNYFTLISGSEPRTDAWTLQVYTDVVMHADDSCVEKPYMKDLFSDWLKVANWLVNTYCATHDPNYTLIGGWTFGETARHGPGNSYAGQCDAFTCFYQSYIGEAWGHSRRMYGATQTDFDGLATVHYTLVDVLYRQTGAFGAYSTTYGLRRMQASGTDVNAVNSISSITDPMIEDSNLAHPTFGDATFQSGASAGGFVLYRTDGLLLGMTPIAYMDVHPLTGDRHYLTNTDVDGTLDDSAWSGPPSANLFQNYYVRQASGSYLGGWKYATTNSDGTIISSFPAFSSSTLSAAITTTGQTTINTAGVLTFQSGTYNAIFPLLVVGNEVMRVTGGAGTTTLTVTRAFGGTTAATALNGAAIYVPYISPVYTDRQVLATPFPTSGHIYRYGVHNSMPDGYNTMMRSQAFYGYLLGKIAKTAFTNADTWFSDASNPAGEGPGGFALNNTLKDSVNASLTS